MLMGLLSGENFDKLKLFQTKLLVLGSTTKKIWKDYSCHRNRSVILFAHVYGPGGRQTLLFPTTEPDRR
jgi:hypothetical protein